MVDVRKDYPAFRRAGGDVAVVTQGSVAQTAEFRARHELPFACLADPARSAYAAYGARQGTLSQIAGPAVWWRAVRALFRHGGGAVVGSATQMPASFVIDRRGIVRYVHYPRHQADLPSHAGMQGVIAACRGG